METRNFRIPLFTLIIIGDIIFVLSLVLGMLFYPGGSRLYPYTEGYSFKDNYLSDMGCIISYSGEYNIISRIFFDIAILLGGVGLIGYYLLLPYLFRECSKIRISCIVGTFFGIVSSVFSISIVFVPLDVDITLHRIFVSLFGAFAIPAQILIMFAIFLDLNYPKIYGYIQAFNVLMFLGHTLLWIIFGFESSFIIEEIKIITQKITIFSQIIVTIIIALSSRYILIEKYRDSQSVHLIS